MRINRLSKGGWISAGSAVLLFAFMFLPWYGVGIDGRPDLLFNLRLYEDGGDAWQTLGVTPIFLVLVVFFALGATFRRLIGRDWRLPGTPGSSVCGLGVVAACLIAVRIVFPPDLGAEVEGYMFSVTLEPGIFLALAAACGVAYGGRRTMQEDS